MTIESERVVIPRQRGVNDSDLERIPQLEAPKTEPKKHVGSLAVSEDVMQLVVSSKNGRPAETLRTSEKAQVINPPKWFVSSQVLPTVLLQEFALLADTRSSRLPNPSRNVTETIPSNGYKGFFVWPGGMLQEIVSAIDSKRKQKPINVK